MAPWFEFGASFIFFVAALQAVSCHPFIACLRGSMGRVFSVCGV